MRLTIENVLARLKNSKRSPDGWTACCPAHEDDRPSLSIREGRKGKILLKCFAGCDYQDIIAALRISSSTHAHSGLRTIVDRYLYRDEAGEIVYCVRRYEPKDFRLYQPDGRGGWSPGVKGIVRLPYRLPTLRKAVLAKRIVYYVEGEKDVKSAREAGLTATTLAGGAEAPIPTGFAEHFRGSKCVVILPDNDDAGRKYAVRIANYLTGADIRCKIVELPRLGPKGDLTDWLCGGGTPQQLTTLVKQAPVHVATSNDAPTDGVSKERELGAGAHASLLVTHLSEVTPETVRWLWRGRIPWGKVVLLEGDPGLGKSFFTLVVAAHVSGGERIPGVDRCEAADVLIVSYEDGVADTIVPRCVAAGADITRIHHIDGVDLHGEKRLLTLPDHIPVLQAWVERTGAKLVIIDPLAAALSGETDSYKDQDVRRVLAPLGHLAEATGATVLVVRHLRKSSGGRAITAGGGSIGIIGAARVALCIGLAPEDSTYGPDARILAVVKSNLAPIPPSLVYRLASADHSSQARIEWLGEASYTADQLTAARDKNTGTSQTQMQEACAMLRDVLAHGKKKKQAVLVMARQNGLSIRTVERAMERLGIVVTRKGQGLKHRAYWSLPAQTQSPHAPTLATSATRSVVARVNQPPSPTRENPSMP